MKRILLFSALVLASPANAHAQDRMTEAEAARTLRTPPAGDQDHLHALLLARELGPRASAELRDAVIGAAWAERRANPHGSEMGGDYAYAVGALEDPRAIPFLIEVLTNAFFASRALADFGNEAFQPVLEAASDPEGQEFRVAGSLEALRMMLDDGVLSSAQTARVRSVTRARLFGIQQRLVVEEAMLLAIEFEDPELRERISALAEDRSAAESLLSPHDGNGTPRSLDFLDRDATKIQERARLVLSGPPGEIGPVPEPPA